METEENGNKNIGHLKSSKMNVVKNQRASLTTVSSFKPICCHDVRINDFLFDRLSKPGRYLPMGTKFTKILWNKFHSPARFAAVFSIEIFCIEIVYVF